MAIWLANIHFANAQIVAKPATDANFFEIPILLNGDHFILPLWLSG